MFNTEVKAKWLGNNSMEMEVNQGGTKNERAEYA